MLPMDTPEFAARVAELSPTRRVPVLWIDREAVWDSLAIAETVNERFAKGQLWPADPALRALGRAMAAEMHSGFFALREALPMNCRAQARRVAIGVDVVADIERVCALWLAARTRSNSGTWLLGGFSIADAMFAPVAVRFHGYAVDIPAQAQDYVDHWLADEDLREWQRLATHETWVIEHEEVGE